jgi:O-succinylbenzoate synthase
VDANGAYSIHDAGIFHALDDFQLMMLKQPFRGSALEEMAELQAQVRPPICLDETQETVANLSNAISLGRFRIATFKIQRIGGFTHALEMYRICRSTRFRHEWGRCRDLRSVRRRVPRSPRLKDSSIRPTWSRASGGFATTSSNRACSTERPIDLPKAKGLGYSINHAKVSQYATSLRIFL